ncbi:hypothetical protein BDW75DRAFT_182598 [Aspergillus navahoensis]
MVLMILLAKHDKIIRYSQMVNQEKPVAYVLYRSTLISQFKAHLQETHHPPRAIYFVFLQSPVIERNQPPLTAQRGLASPHLREPSSRTSKSVAMVRKETQSQENMVECQPTAISSIRIILFPLDLIIFGYSVAILITLGEIGKGERIFPLGGIVGVPRARGPVLMASVATSRTVHPSRSSPFVRTGETSNVLSIAHAVRLGSEKYLWLDSRDLEYGKVLLPNTGSHYSVPSRAF